ncbi:hypothetical protein Rhopal_004219-T1 [Rhodotorula paludigena]|uniref:Signal recognition particle, SRP19 subunit n=1 Tax=Rhodotorula paludigena TaxID=86838 RepID=A0AAV5GF92_9BASI|nr:hypothetical protein Rhopal_004219-T1 [Rhodotorula paludigena]
MPTIEDYASDPDDMELELSSAPAPAPSAAAKGKAPAMPPPPPGAGGLFDNEPAVPKALRILPDGSLGKVFDDAHSRWDTLYPIYIDAKHPQQDGARRVNRETALEWPIAEQMAKACRMLGFDTVFEPSKTHPKDWANPGRVKVQLRDGDGKPRNPSIKNKRILLNRIAVLLKPHQPVAPAPTASNPHPLPPIHRRLPANSPAISHGVLAQAVEGKGPLAGMMGGLGGGEDEDAAEKARVEREEEEKRKREQMIKMMKGKKVHIKRRR